MEALEGVENFSDDNFRGDIRNPLPKNLAWYTAIIENGDISKLYIISSDDWGDEHLCEPDFKLLTAISNYQKSTNGIGKYNDIKNKEKILKNDLDSIDTKLLIVAPGLSGPFTIIEGNKRAIALGSLDKLNNLEIFLGISSAIKNYHWARYSK